MGAIVKELGAYYTDSMKRDLLDLVQREEKLRVSGFPFCGLKKVYEKLAVEKDTNTQAGKEYYTSVGTAAHLVFQRWLGTNGRLWGDWKCRNKKCNHIVRFSNNPKCPKCKKEMEYEEFTVHYGKNVSGHLDGVYQSMDGRFWVIDYKTSSCKAIYAHRRSPEPYFPYAKNRVQIMSYCFHPDTLVVTEGGLRKLLDLCGVPNPPKVLSFNHNTGETEFKEITNSSVHGTDEEMYEIEYESGTLRVTENHEVWSVTRNGYVKAKDLDEGEEILATKTVA